jgi:hypothetical protein
LPSGRVVTSIYASEASLSMPIQQQHLRAARVPFVPDKYLAGSYNTSELGAHQKVRQVRRPRMESIVT